MIDSGLAHLSDTLFTTSIAIYAVGLVGFFGEYSFGRAGRVARTNAAAAEPERELVGAGVGAGGAAEAEPVDAEPVERPAGLADRVLGALSTLAERGGGADAGARIAGRFGRVALALTVLGLATHVASVFIRGLAVGRAPWGNMYEFTSAIGLVAVSVFVVMVVRMPASRHIGGFVMLPVVVLMFLAGTVLYATAGPLMPALRSYWLAIHVTAAALSTGIFLVSFVATALFLVRDRYDRAIAAGRTPSRFPVSAGGRLPDAALLDSVAYRTLAFGFPLWTFGIIAGAIWAEAAWGEYWGWDPKETWALIAWVVYAAYLHARATAGWKGAKAGWINVLGFGTMIFNFFVVNIVISGLHSYAGLS